jgi:hypothetical protein
MEVKFQALLTPALDGSELSDLFLRPCFLIPGKEVLKRIAPTARCDAVERSNTPANVGNWYPNPLQATPHRVACCIRTDGRMMLNVKLRAQKIGRVLS